MPRTDIRQNPDGTITCIYGKRRSTITPMPWWTQAETIEHCKWELVSLGASLAPTLDKTTQGEYHGEQPTERDGHEAAHQRK